MHNPRQCRPRSQALSPSAKEREGEPANVVETLQLGHIFAVEFVWQTATRKGKK